MRQLLLDITADDAQTLNTFVTGNNQEVLQFLRQLTAPSAATAPGDRFVYLWGQSGAGKSHLLQAFARSTNAHLISAADLNAQHVDAYNESYPARVRYLLERPGNG